MMAHVNRRDDLGLTCTSSIEVSVTKRCWGPFCENCTILWHLYHFVTKLYHFVTPVPFCDKVGPFCDKQSCTILWHLSYHFVSKKKLYHFVTKSYHFMNYEFLLAKSDTFRKFPNFRFINGNFYWFYVQLTLNRLSSCKINTILSRDQSTMAFKWNWLADKIELSRVREIWD